MMLPIGQANNPLNVTAGSRPVSPITATLRKTGLKNLALERGVDPPQHGGNVIGNFLKPLQFQISRGRSRHFQASILSVWRTAPP